MSASLGIFYFLGIIAILSAMGILITKNVLHGAFLLIISFFCIAGIYVLANASFIGVTQLLIYVGGILVLMIFGVMLTNKLNGKALVTENHNKFIGPLIGTLFFLVLSYVLLLGNYSAMNEGAIMPENNIAFIGIHLMSDYLVAFEVAAVLLLLALIGAAVMSEQKREKL